VKCINEKFIFENGTLVDSLEKIWYNKNNIYQQLPRANIKNATALIKTKKR